MSSFVDPEKNWIRARSFTFPQDYSKLVCNISRDLRESFSSSFFLRGRNFNANADNVTFGGNYTPNFKLPSHLHPSSLPQKRRGRREKRIDSCETLIELRTVRSINGSFDSKSGGASIAPTIKMIPSFRDLVPFPLPFSKKNFPCGAREAEQIFLLCKTDLTRTRAEFHVGRQR